MRILRKMRIQCGYLRIQCGYLRILIMCTHKKLKGTLYLPNYLYLEGYLKNQSCGFGTIHDIVLSRVLKKIQSCGFHTIHDTYIPQSVYLPGTGTSKNIRLDDKTESTIARRLCASHITIQDIHQLLCNYFIALQIQYSTTSAWKLCQT